MSRAAEACGLIGVALIAVGLDGLLEDNGHPLSWGLGSVVGLAMGIWIGRSTRR